MRTFVNAKHLPLLGLLLLLTSVRSMAIESPQYTVIHSEGWVEYRQYQPYLVAETVVTGSSSYGAASNEGFMRLFAYITGNNSSQSKIDMTAPVQQATAGEEIAMTAPVQRVETAQGWSVAFMLPSKFTLDTAPVPTDARITLRPVAGQLMAVVRYSGRWTERNYENHKQQLLNGLAKANIGSVGEVESAAYDAPYVLPFLRRNEVMIEVTSVPADMNAVTATGNS